MAFRGAVERYTADAATKECTEHATHLTRCLFRRVPHASAFQIIEFVHGRGKLRCVYKRFRLHRQVVAENAVVAVSGNSDASHGDCYVMSFVLLQYQFETPQVRDLCWTINKM